MVILVDVVVIVEDLLLEGREDGLVTYLDFLVMVLIWTLDILHFPHSRIRRVCLSTLEGTRQTLFYRQIYNSACCTKKQIVPSLTIHITLYWNCETAHATPHNYVHNIICRNAESCPRHTSRLGQSPLNMSHRQLISPDKHTY